MRGKRDDRGGDTVGVERVGGTTRGGKWGKREGMEEARWQTL